MTMAIAGVAIGAALAAFLTQFIESSLFGVRATDWVSFGATAAVMLLAALIASVAPALKALRLDPLAALRSTSV